MKLPVSHAKAGLDSTLVTEVLTVMDLSLARGKLENMRLMMLRLLVIFWFWCWLMACLKTAARP